MPGVNKILFFGATGMAGIPVYRSLSENGINVTAFARNPEKAIKLLPKGSNIIKGNLKFRNDIEKSLKGFDSIFISLSTDYDPKAFQPEYHGIRNILLFASRYEIQRIFLTSCIITKYNNGDFWALDIKKNAVKVIKDSGIPYTIFYPSLFIESISQKLIRDNSIYCHGIIKAIKNWISTEDFGSAVLNFVRSSNSVNKEYSVQGSKNYVINDLIKSLAKSNKLRKRDLSLAYLKIAGFFSNEADYYYNLLRIISKSHKQLLSDKHIKC